MNSLPGLSAQSNTQDDQGGQLSLGQILRLEHMSIRNTNRVRFVEEEEVITEQQYVAPSLQEQEYDAYLNCEIHVPENEIGSFRWHRRRRVFDDHKIDVLVGPSEHRCWLHRGLLWQHSLFFRNLLLTKETTSSTTPEFRFAEEKEFAFTVFADWLHYRYDFGTGKSVKDDSYDVCLLFHCYALAIKLQAPKFKEYIFGEIKIYCNQASTTITLDQIRHVYQNTRQADDQLRRYCIWKICAQAPIDRTLSDPEFVEMVRGGGPLVHDLLEAHKML